MKKLLCILLCVTTALSLAACGKEKEEKPVTSDTKEGVLKMVEEFYGALPDSDPVSMSTFAGQQEEPGSVFSRESGKVSVSYPALKTTYYAFTENGRKYLIMDNKTAVENATMYDAYNGTLKDTLETFIYSYFNVIEGGDDADFKYSGTKTVTGKKDTKTTELVHTVTGTIKEIAVVITVKGIADKDGRITSIEFEMTAGENHTLEKFLFTYDGVTVTLPEYKIAS